MISDNLCVRCGQPMPDQAYACSSCAYRAGDQLHAIVDTTLAARDIAHGFARRGTSGGGSTEPRLILNLGATQRLDAVQGSLTTWVRHVMATRGILGPGIAGDPLVAAARWLAGHVEWMRHRREVDEFLADVEACSRVVSGIARGPAAQRYLGPCGYAAQVDITAIGQPPGSKFVDGEVCEGDVYAREGAQHGACRTCGATVGTRDRQAWLNGEVRSRAFRASQIAEAYKVNVNTIRTWASRARPDTGEPPLASYWRTEGGLITPWVDPTLDPNLKGDELKDRLAVISDEITARGGRLHYVGDVLDLAAADAARRATEQAKRARRAAVKAEEASDAA